MQQKKFEFEYAVYNSSSELPAAEQDLLQRARAATSQAYAPYSSFRVGAAARLANGEMVTGSNQENASFPVGLCAERVLLASAASLFSHMPIEAIAVSYQTGTQPTDHPIAPCGVCRQSLQEWETRAGGAMKVILGGLTGPVYVLDSVSQLLPLAFTKDELRQ